MSVADQLIELRNRSVAQIEKLQDFHIFTGHSYDRYAKMVGAGHLTETVTNVRTATTLADKQVADVLLSYLDDELPQVVLFQVVAAFEGFFFDLLRLLLQQNPYALSQQRKLAVADVLARPDFAALIDHLIELELHELRYKSVAEWFQFLPKIIKLDAPTSSDIERLAELKATRDIFAHNAGVANEIYVRKAGSHARAFEGAALTISRPYLYDAVGFLKRLVSDLVAKAFKRLTP